MCWGFGGAAVLMFDPLFFFLFFLIVSAFVCACVCVHVCLHVCVFSFATLNEDHISMCDMVPDLWFFVTDNCCMRLL